MHSVLAIIPVVSLPAVGLEGSEATPDGGFASAFGEGVDDEAGEPCGDACPVPAQTLAGLWTSVAGLAGVAETGAPGAESARSGDGFAVDPGVPAGRVDAKIAPALAANTGKRAMAASADLPQPGVRLPAAESIGSCGNSADETARSGGLVVSPHAQVTPGPAGDAWEGTPTASGRAAADVGAKDLATGAPGMETLQPDPVQGPGPSESLPAHGRVRPAGRENAAPAAPAPMQTAAEASSSGPVRKTSLPVLPDAEGALSGPGLPFAAPTAAPRLPEPKAPGDVPLPPVPTDSSTPVPAEAPTPVSGQSSRLRGPTQDPAEGASETVPTPPEDGQPPPQRPGFWERFFTGAHTALVAEPATMEPHLPASAPTGARPQARADAIGETPDLQPGPALPEDPVPKPDGRPAAAGAALPAAAALWSNSARLPSGSATDLSLEQKTEPDTDLAPAALSPGPMAWQGPASTVAPQAAALPMAQVAAQITAGLTRSPEGTTELALAPEELGHVRLKLKPDATNPDRMVVMITFERPETLDLFRRHAGELTEALRLAGYAGADIGFGQEGSGAPGSDRPQGASSSGFEKTAGSDGTDPIVAAPRRMAGASLDLRL